MEKFVTLAQAFHKNTNAGWELFEGNGNLYETNKFKGYLCICFGKLELQNGRPFQLVEFSAKPYRTCSGNDVDYEHRLHGHHTLCRIASRDHVDKNPIRLSDHSLVLHCPQRSMVTF